MDRRYVPDNKCLEKASHSGVLQGGALVSLHLDISILIMEWDGGDNICAIGRSVHAAPANAT